MPNGEGSMGASTARGYHGKGQEPSLPAYLDCVYDCNTCNSRLHAANPANVGSLLDLVYLVSDFLFFSYVC